jgi:hypothetical protein
MKNNRPCECGCSFEEHKAIVLESGLICSLYCMNCDKHQEWCYNYRPIKNIEYLEWLSK